MISLKLLKYHLFMTFQDWKILIIFSTNLMLYYIFILKNYICIVYKGLIYVKSTI